MAPHEESPQIDTYKLHSRYKMQIKCEVSWAFTHFERSGFRQNPVLSDIRNQLHSFLDLPIDNNIIVVKQINIVQSAPRTLGILIDNL